MLTAAATTSLQIADLAVAAIRAEADLTPKPGLVDRRGSGAHPDMDLALLHASADALHSAFSECAPDPRWSTSPGLGVRSASARMAATAMSAIWTVVSAVAVDIGVTSP